MAFLRLGALALSCISAASAFQGTSPLFAFSTSKQLDSVFNSPPPPIASASSIIPKIEELASRCAYKNYILVSQPQVSSQDFSVTDSAPHLKRWLVNKDDGVASSFMVPEVLGQIDLDAISRILEKKCGGTVTKPQLESGYIIHEKEPQIVRVDFPALPSDRRQRTVILEKHDSFLNALVSGLQTADFVVFYTTTPPLGRLSGSTDYSGEGYEMDEEFPSVVHGELKRDLEYRATVRNKSNLALFDKYQFLSPGIFMGLIAALPLLLILYVGLSALSSLEVSYFAFSKEMGPSAQKKQG